MVVCRNFSSGYCRFGDRCKFEHTQAGPGPNSNSRNGNPRGTNIQNSHNNQNSHNSHNNQNSHGSQNQYQNHNQYQNQVQMQNQRNGNYRNDSPARQGGRNAQHNSPPRGHNSTNGNVNNKNRKSHPWKDTVDYTIMSARTIEDDMTIDRPEWFCSSYGAPGRDCAAQLLGGAMECSPEEARIQFYLSALGGNIDKARADEEMLAANCMAQISNVIKDPHGAVKYLANEAKSRPNRIDTVRKANQDVFRARSHDQKQFFSRENAQMRRERQAQLERQNGASSGHQPSQNSFAQNQPTNNPAPFGQIQPTPQFGAAAPFGQPQAGPSTFGQPQPQPNNAFGQTAPPAPAFGQPVQNANVFGQPQQNSFAQPNFQPAPPAAFPAPPNNTFGSAAPANGPAPQILQQQQQQQQQQQPPKNVLFGHGQGQSAPTSFSQATVPAPNNASSAGNGTSFAADGKLSLWNFNPVQYVRDYPVYRLPDGRKQRIWFPKGEPAETKFFAAALPSLDEYPAEVEQVYEQLLATGKFPDNNIPSMAPRPEWCGWNC